MCCDILLDLIATGASDETNSVHITTNFTNDELDCLMDFLKRGSLPVKSDGTQQLDVSKTEAFSALGIDLMWVSTGVRSGMLDGTRRQPVTHCVDPQIRMKLAAAHHHDRRGPEVHLKKEGIKNEPAADSYYFEPLFMPPVDNVEVQYEDEDYEEKPAFIRPADTEKKKGVNKRKSVQSGVPSAAVPSKKRRSEKEDPFFFPQEGDRDLETLKYQCQNCVRGFRDLDDYRQHFLRHMYREDPDSKDRPYTCLRCFNFRGKHAQVESHMRGPCKDARYKDEESLINYFCVFCPDGGSVHDTVEAFNKHLQHKHPEKDDALVRIHKCVACGSGWPTLKTLRRHMLKEGPYHDNKCVLCHQVQETWTDHLAHVEQEHSGVGFRHKCGSCGSVAFDTKTEMKNHRKFCSQVRYIGNSLERNPEMTTCRLCETELEARIMPIHEHFNKYHLDDMVKCVICGKGFASKNSLQLHVRRDHAQTVHQCELCEKSFPLINQLKAHKMSVHTANELKRFHCGTCGKGFATKPEHHRHLLTHDPMHKAINAKKRMCDLCGAEVNERSYRKHLQVYY